MNSRKILAGFCLTFFYLSVAFGLYATAQEPLNSSGKTTGHKNHASIQASIKIDNTKVFGRSERPIVEFPHDLHTEALKKENKNCSSCHLNDNGKQSFKFMRQTDVGKKELMGIYHGNCIGCHVEMGKRNAKSGPVTCGQCHVNNPPTSSSLQPAGFDKKLHQLHSKNQNDNCAACHHEYDSNSKKLVYIQGKEGSCRYCHKESAEGNVTSIKTASHDSCILCHLENIDKKRDSGPVQCRECHDPAQKKKADNLTDVPRIKRGQPDFTIVSNHNKSADSSEPDADKVKDAGFSINPVPFSHKAHEEYSGSCIACHHKNFSACSECHSLQGKKEGASINLSDAMHMTDSTKSCIGCHEQKKNDRICSGCHELMPKGTGQPGTCLKCHVDKASQGKEKPKTYSEKEIPEKIEIGHLSNKYEPVDFPHRKIIDALYGNIKNSRLADSFHEGMSTICQGCHHNSPKDKKPPACISCHAGQGQKGDDMKPGIIGAYHNQCMGCHREMGITQASSCTDCHKEKK